MVFLLAIIQFPPSETLKGSDFCRTAGRTGSQGRQWRLLKMVEAIIRGFPVLTGLTEPSWCWVSIQAAGLGCFVVLFSPSLKEDSQVESLHEAPRTLPPPPHRRETSFKKDNRPGGEQLEDSGSAWQQVNTAPV